MVPPTCTMLVAIILFALLLSISAATTIICHHARPKLPWRLRLPQHLLPQMWSMDPLGHPTLRPTLSPTLKPTLRPNTEADTEAETAGNIEARTEGGAAETEQEKAGDNEEDPVPRQGISPA